MQFRLRTLLIVIAVAGIFFLGLRWPISLMALVVSTITLVTVLLAVLNVTFCTGAARASSIGYLVFCVGSLIHPAVAKWIGQSTAGEPTPAWAAFVDLYMQVHFAAPSGMGAANFAKICHDALSCTLGLAGAFTAELLYRRMPTQSAQSGNP